MTVVKRYFQANRDGGAKVLKRIRDRLVDLGLYREIAIFQKLGGRSGDLAAESMEFEVYHSGSENGMTRGAVYVYSVVDDSSSGFMQSFSVLIDLPEDRDRGSREAINAFLDELDFVGKHVSFQERPFGYKSYRGYLDDWSGIAGLHETFAYEERVLTRRQAT